MWWWGWFVVWAVIVYLMMSMGGYYGYRRAYYGAGPAIGLLILLFIIFWLAIFFAGPYWGWYGYGWW